jgi:hypothetical protein
MAVEYVTVKHNEKYEKRKPLPGTAAPSQENFEGNDRETAKTSIATAAPREFATVADLLSSGMFVADKKMIAHKPPITKDGTSERVSEEKFNVTITGFLYAAKKEDDNDFHCIVGTAKGSTPHFVNVEVSGLPQGQFRAPLKTARDQFKAFFGDHLPAAGSYAVFKTPIKVQITGSIFFDIDHKAGVVGPTGMRPTTAWEIHPVTEFLFPGN